MDGNTDLYSLHANPQNFIDLSQDRVGEHKTSKGTVHMQYLNIESRLVVKADV